MTFSAEIKLREEGFTLTLQETRSRLHEKKTKLNLFLK